jgi:hypothetical protein
LYKSLLSPEELNALLTSEQVSELTTADRQTGEQPAHSTEGDLIRIQQLELDIRQLMKRVELLESKLLDQGQLPIDPSVHAVTAAAESSSQGSSVQEVAAAASDATLPPVILSRVEKYKLQKPKKSLFR